MAQTMGQIVRDFSPEFERQPVPSSNMSPYLAHGQFEIPDRGVTTPVASGSTGDFGNPMHYFKVTAHLKTFVPGTAFSYFAIEVADDEFMSAGVRVIATAGVPAVAGDYCLHLCGVCPDGAKRYARVFFIAGAGASGVYDAFLGGCP